MILWRAEDLTLARLDVPAGGFPRHAQDESVRSVNVNGRESVILDRRGFEAGLDGLTLCNPGQVQSSTAVTDGAPWRLVSLYVGPVGWERLFGRAVPFERPWLARPDWRRRCWLRRWRCSRRPSAPERRPEPVPGCGRAAARAILAALDRLAARPPCRPPPHPPHRRAVLAGPGGATAPCC